MSCKCHAAIMVSKIDQCMLDLMKYHGEGEESGSAEMSDRSNEQIDAPSATVMAALPPKLADVSRKSCSEPAHTDRHPAGILDSASSAREIQQPGTDQRQKDAGRFL